MNKFRETLSFVFVFAITITAQNTDSLFNNFWSAYSFSQHESITTAEETLILKCGTNHIYYLKNNFDKLNINQQNKIASILQRPSTQKSLVSPSGYFRIHYDTTGIHQVGYSLTELAIAVDSVYSFEIDFLGYPPPPPDGTQGGDDKYDIYIQDIGSIYGWTDFASTSNSTSFMVIDNNFDIHYTKGIDGAKVTLAHEFYHAIQVGSYKYRSEDSYYYELLSTSMEEFVFDTINDYYDYISGYYNNPQAPFYATFGGGYDLAIWNIFLQNKYGYDIIKRGLENVVNHSALNAIALSISEYGGSFKEDLAEFGIWNYFTGSRAKEGKYFKEARFYPKVKPLMNMNFRPTSETVTVNSNPSSNNYLLFVDFSRGLPDSLVAIITNCDYQSKSRTEFSYTLYSFNASGSSQINDLFYSSILSNNRQIFLESVIFNNELAAEGRTERLEIDYAYPQPFNYNKHSYVFIPAAADQSGKSSLNIYTIGMDLVFSGEKNIFATDKIVVRWDGKTANGERLPTGVYVYVTKSGDTVKKGKLVIYNE